MADKFARLAALRPAPRTVAREERSFAEESQRGYDPDECELARLLGATVARTRFGSHLSVRNWHATPEFPQFCGSTLDVLCQSRDTARERKARAAVENPEKWLFLDTETTGLAGGTGTYAFLVGIAWWDAGGLQVEQFLMRDFSEEHSLLEELAGRIAERPVLVTFNGKSFDWPLLENRYVMTRSIRVPQLAAHLDLLHPARAVWKLRLGSVRLVELERRVLDAARLGWHREDDVPSSLIPQFYFDYLRGGPATPLAGVVRHNRMDLRGLAALFGKLNALLGSEQEHEEAEGLDLFGLSRFLQRRGERKRAESGYAAARDAGLPTPFDGLAQWELAKMAKRNGEHEEAARLWEELAEDPEWRVEACEELALFHERQRKDLKAAVEYARQAIVAVRKRSTAHRNGARSAGDLRRFERLTKKIARLELRLTRSSNAPPLLRAAR